MDDECKRCGWCCINPTIVAPMTEKHVAGEFLRWVEGFGFNVFVKDGWAHVKVPGRCIHLDGAYNCMIYDVRPQICRGFECEAEKRKHVDTSG